MSDTFGRPGPDGDPVTGDEVTGDEAANPAEGAPADRVNLDDPGDDAFAVRTGTPNPRRSASRGASSVSTAATSAAPSGPHSTTGTPMRKSPRARVSRSAMESASTMRPHIAFA